MEINWHRGSLVLHILGRSCGVSPVVCIAMGIITGVGAMHSSSRKDYQVKHPGTGLVVTSINHRKIAAYVAVFSALEVCGWLLIYERKLSVLLWKDFAGVGVGTLLGAAAYESMINHWGAPAPNNPQGNQHGTA